jgi:Zn-dependent protease
MDRSRDGDHDDDPWKAIDPARINNPQDSPSLSSAAFEPKISSHAAFEPGTGVMQASPPSWEQEAPPEASPYQQPPPPAAAPQHKSKPRGIMTIIGVIIAVLIKFKAIIFLVLLKLKTLLIAVKFLHFGAALKTMLSMLITVWLYAIGWGWPFAIGFVLLIFVHEMGHSLALRAMGIKASVPIFIPFMGAFIAMKENPPNAKVEAWTGIAGPIAGTIGAIAVWMLYFKSGSFFWLDLAYVGFLLNLFNLIPLSPLDGGRVVAAISPKAWVVGFVVMILFFFTSFNPIILFILILGFPRVLSVFRKDHTLDQAYYSVDMKNKVLITLAYFGLALFLIIAMSLTHRMPVADHALLVPMRGA